MEKQRLWCIRVFQSSREEGELVYCWIPSKMMQRDQNRTATPANTQRTIFFSKKVCFSKFYCFMRLTTNLYKQVFGCSVKSQQLSKIVLLRSSKEWLSLEMALTSPSFKTPQLGAETSRPEHNQPLTHWEFLQMSQYESIWKNLINTNMARIAKKTTCTDFPFMDLYEHALWNICLNGCW